MIPGMNSRQMKQMMKKMGVAQQEIEATEVIIKTADTEYVFENPQVSKVNMMGQNTFQVVGTPVERSLDSTPEINDDDVITVMEQTGKSREISKEAIDNAKGDLAEAIINLQSEE